MRSRAFPLFLLLSFGCGPVYDTTYRFTDPTSAFGRECVEGCKDQKEACSEIERDRKESCDERQQAQMRDCEERIAREKQRGPKWTECGKTAACTENTSRCDEMYRTCFRSCGGGVEEEKVCVAFCDGR